MAHFPAGTSSKLTTHFAQFILKGNNQLSRKKINAIFKKQ